MCRLPPRPTVCRLPALLAAVLAAGPYCAATRQQPEFWGFTGPWDARSAASVRDHGAQLDAVITGWIALDSVRGQPILPPPYADTIRPRDGAPARMAIVTSWHGDRFHAHSIRTLARDRAALGRAAGELARFAGRAGYDGLVFDFETLERADLDGHIRVLQAFTDSARRQGVRTFAVALPATDTVNYPARRFLPVADALVVMVYDQHWPGSEPGPISGPAWVRDALALRLAEVGPEPIVAALPLYGYRWPAGRPGEPVSFAEAQAHAAGAGAPLRRDPASRTLRSVAPDGAETWVADAELLRVLAADIRAAGVHRFAFWRLGQEDPAIWTTLFE
jgi:spore germination protein YaaH